MLAGMNAHTRGIPLVPDPSARERELRRSYCRAVAALALAQTAGGQDAERIVRREWADDAHAALVVRGAVEPLKTTDSYLRIDAIKLLASLAPRSAASRLFELAQPVELSGISSVLFPLPGSLPTAAFIAEAAPIPVLQGTLANAMRVGPARKLALISPLTEELESASAGTASVVIERLLEVGISRGLDRALFSSDPPSDTAPAGLLYGVAALPPGTSMAEDLSNLVSTIASAGYDAESVVFVAEPAEALKLRLVAGPAFASTYRIIAAHKLPPKSVVAIDASALAFAYSGSPETVRHREPTVHMEDVPLALVSGGGTVAAPTKGLWQCHTLAVRTIARVAWAVGSGALAWTTAVVW
jgi:hypothetical protein